MRPELEKGSKKHTCPACSQKRFVRYVNPATSDYYAPNVGRCDRQSSCRYHFPPRMYFAENPSQKSAQRRRGRKSRTAWQDTGLKSRSKPKQTIQKATSSFEVIPNEYLIQSLGNYDQNSFVRFLVKLFPFSESEVWQSVKDYLIGTTKTGKTIFWQIDGWGNIRTGKIIAYDRETGRRTKRIFPNWTHAELKKLGLLKSDFNLKQCFFGEHLLNKEPEKVVAIVEAEKTAVICSILFPEFLWLAVGAKAYLTDQRFRLFSTRKVLLYPDADAYLDWKEKAVRAQRKGIDVRISEHIETHATASEKEDGSDLADYLINKQIDKLEQYDSYVTLLNATLDMVLADKKLEADFEAILEEQKSTLVISGHLSETEAESEVTQIDNVRKIVMSI